MTSCDRSLLAFWSALASRMNAWLDEQDHDAGVSQQGLCRLAASLTASAYDMAVAMGVRDSAPVFHVESIPGARAQVASLRALLAEHLDGYEILDLEVQK